MESKAHLRNLRIAPRKLRLVADLVRGKLVDQAIAELSFTRKAGSEEVRKLLQSAKANAVNNHDSDGRNLIVKTIYVNEGVTLKRVLPRARGRADRMSKRSSHATVVLSDKAGV